MNLKRRDFLKAGSLGAGGLMLTQFVNQLEAAPKAKPARVLFFCLLYTSPSPRDRTRSRMPSSA